MNTLHTVMLSGDTRYTRVLYAKLSNGVSQQGVRDVVRAAKGSEGVNMSQYEAWEKLCKSEIIAKFQLESILRDSRVIGVRLSVGKVLRNAILKSKDCLLPRVQKAQVINIAIYIDSRRMTKHTGSSIFNIACTCGNIDVRLNHTGASSEIPSSADNFVEYADDTRGTRSIFGCRNSLNSQYNYKYQL